MYEWKKKNHWYHCSSTVSLKVAYEKISKL